ASSSALTRWISVSVFFQAEDGIRDRNVTGVQTCALPILLLIGAHEKPIKSHELSEKLLVSDSYLKKITRQLVVAGFITSMANKRDRKSTRLNSSHVSISYAVFCLKKKIYN